MIIGGSAMSHGELHDSNIRSPAFFIARTTAVCGQCGEPTRLIALALPQDHETLDADDWQHANLTAFIFYVVCLPQPVRNQLLQVAPFYRLDRSESTLSSYWSNHCERCDSLQDDHELFCEPDGAFTPTDEKSAAAIELMQVAAQFEAVAAGYAYQPEFFSFMRNSARSSWPSSF
jgi:hypothetical protein